MKKFILFPLAALLLCACTTEEQSQQIRLFWLKQYAAVMTQKLANMQPQANGQSLQALLTEFQKSPSVSQSAAAQNTPAAAAQQRQKPAPQIMEVTLDTEALPGRAPKEERVKMKHALEAVQLSNQTTLTDIAATFGDNVKYQAFLLTAETERQLKQAAAQSADFNAYLTAQQQLLVEQDKKLNQLMQKNAGSIKKIRR